MKPLTDCLLYAFVDTAYLRGRTPESVAVDLCHGGADILQLRAKDRSPDQIERIARGILPLAAEAKIWFVVNDHPEIAVKTGAPLCHLGQEDLKALGHSDVRAVMPAHPSLQFGLSSHAPDQALGAVAAGASYVAVGPVFPTPTKPGRPAVTLEYVRWAAANLELPWFAIGGINRRTLDDVLEAGARRVCVVSDSLNAPDIAEACSFFREKLDDAMRSSPDAPPIRRTAAVHDK